MAANGSVPSVMFYFDVGSPYAYLAAERIHTLLPEPVSWQPVLLGGLFKLTGRSSWELGDYRRRQTGMAEIERRARLYGRLKQVLRDATDAAYRLGVFGVPTVAVEGELFWGDDRLEDAAARGHAVTH